MCVYVQRGMETVLNSDQDHAEIMALYVDTCQRGRLGKLGEKESEAAVVSCLEMLRYLAVCSMHSIWGLLVSSRRHEGLAFCVCRTKICFGSTIRCFCRVVC